jgi:hypothetical protein
MAGTTTLLPGRGWIANALAWALILALAPPILLSVVLALIPALAFLFVLLLTIAAVRSTGRQITKNYEQVFMAIVPCVEDTNKTNQKAAVSLPVTLPTNGGKLISDLTSTPSLSTDENLSDLFADLEDLTDEIAGSSDSSDDSTSILDVNVKIRLDKMKRDPDWKEKVTGWLTYESMMMSNEMVREWYDITRPDETVFAEVDENPDQYVYTRLEVIVEEEDEE